MKTKYWLNGGKIFGIIFSLVLCFATLITFIVLSIFNNEMWIMAVVFAVFVVGLIVCLFYDKAYLSQIEFTGEGIKWTWLNKTEFIKWSQFYDARMLPNGWGFPLLRLVYGNEKYLDIFISTRKMYEALVANCTNGNLRFAIENLKFLDPARRPRKKDKQQ